jgi:hypothetical protein
MTNATRHRGVLSNLTGLLPAIALALIGVGLVLYLTRDGAGAGGDSAWYVMGAQNLLAGNGYARFSGGGELRPITGFPPFFSVVLAGISATGLEPFTGAQLLNTILFGANLLLVGLLIFKASKSRWAAVIGVLLVLTSANLIESHSWIMSEPLYIFLSLLVAHFVSLGIPAGDRRLFAAAGLIGATAILTRYSGFSLVAAGAVCIALLGPRGVRWRLPSSALFSALGLVPPLWWLWTQASDGGTLANRQIIFHAMNPELVLAYQREFVTWAFARQLNLSWRPRAILALIVAAIGPIYFVVSRLRRSRLRLPKVDHYGEALPWFLGIYLVAYMGVLVANSLFLDAATTLGAPSRYLAPAYVALVILASITTADLVNSIKSTRLPAAFALSLGLLLVGLHLGQSLEILSDDGLNLGYVDVKQNTPYLVAGLSDIDPSTSIISNNPEMIFILANRTAYLLPIRVDAYTQSEREDYKQNIMANRRRLEQGAILVILGNPDEGALEAMNDLNVTPLQGFSSAMFYQAGEG